MNVEFCEDNSGTSKKMRYFRKNKVGIRAPRAPPLDPPLCKENHIEDGQHLLMYFCKGNDNIRKELHSIILKTDSHFVNLADHEKIMYLLK